MIPSPLQALDYVDSQLRILAAKVNESFDTNSKGYYATLAGAQVAGTFGAVVGLASGKGLGSLTIGVIGAKTADGLRDCYDTAGLLEGTDLLNMPGMFQDLYPTLTRKSHLVLATTYFIKPVVEFFTSGVAESPILDYGISMNFLMAAAPHYLKNDDKDGLRRRRQIQAEKNSHEQLVPVTIDEMVQ